MLRKFIMNTQILRNAGLIMGEVNNYSNQPGQFTPYFQYEVGPYQDEFTLYFRKVPGAILYYNSIFLKLWGYYPQDAIKYIEAHFALYSDKQDFLLFLKRQLQYRMSLLKNRSKLSISSVALEWVNERLAGWKDEQKIISYNQFIRQDFTVIVKNELQQTLPSSSTISHQSL